MDTGDVPNPHCSFCHKSQDAVSLLIANPTVTIPRVYICDECVAVCNSIIEEHGDYKRSHSMPGRAPERP